MLQEYLPRFLTQGQDLSTVGSPEKGPTMAGGEGASGPNKIKGGNWTVVRFFTVSVSSGASVPEILHKPDRVQELQFRVSAVFVLSPQDDGLRHLSSKSNRLRRSPTRSSARPSFPSWATTRLYTALQYCYC